MGRHGTTRADMLRLCVPTFDAILHIVHRRQHHDRYAFVQLSYLQVVCHHLRVGIFRAGIGSVGDVIGEGWA
jgi:hypothetical protein